MSLFRKLITVVPRSANCFKILKFNNNYSLLYSYSALSVVKTNLINNRYQTVRYFSSSDEKMSSQSEIEVCTSDISESSQNLHFHSLLDEFVVI